MNEEIFDEKESTRKTLEVILASWQTQLSDLDLDYARDEENDDWEEGEEEMLLSYFDKQIEEIISLRQKNA